MVETFSNFDQFIAQEPTKTENIKQIVNNHASDHSVESIGKKSFR